MTFTESIAPEHVQDRINHYWDVRAEAYDFNQRRQVQDAAIVDAWRQVWSHALPPAPASVLDVGTGTGRVAHLLAELGYETVGTDLSEGMLARARAGAEGLEPTPVFLVGDAIDPQFDAGTFDAVTARYVVWTLHDPVRALSNWHRILKPGGRLVVVDGTWFPEGVHSNRGESETPDAFRQQYSETVVDNLPLAEASTIEDTVAAVREAGFANVEVAALPQIEQLDRAYADDLDQAVRTQYVITATA